TARVDAEAFQHGLQALLGEGRVGEPVARAVEADDQTIAHELVVAHALDIDDILDAGGSGLRGGKRREADDECHQAGQHGAQQQSKHWYSPFGAFPWSRGGVGWSV